ncbi:MAG: TraM recognition domain-containing protein [Saprospiraceae bacterium]
MLDNERLEATNLDYPLLEFSDNVQDAWTIRDAVRGVQIFGGIGSGKSSGSGKWIAKTFLKNGFGGLILCAKPDESTNWIKYAEEVGRKEDLIIFSEGSKYEFNPLEYEMKRSSKGGGEIYNLANLFMEIYKMGNRLGGGGTAKETERFWDNALRRCLNRMLQLLKLAGEEISIKNMRRLISVAPMEHEIEIYNEMNDKERLEWANKNYCYGCIMDAGGKAQEEEEEEFELVYDYFMREFANLPEKMRPTIAESFLGLAEPFSTGILKKHFSTGTNIIPEVTHEGKIIILDFPVKEYLQAGVYAQGIFKLLWQQATERRNPNENLIPVFLWVDEAHLFLSDYDQIFQTTARSSKACTVFISQNISNYYVSIGGYGAVAKVDSLLGNLGTKIFHANNDAVTNEWAAKTIGKALKSVEGVSTGYQNQSVSLNKQHLWQVEPKDFTVLSSGGENNDYQVQGIVTVAGRQWSDGKNYGKISFDQRI